MFKCTAGKKESECYLEYDGIKYYEGQDFYFEKRPNNNEVEAEVAKRMEAQKLLSESYGTAEEVSKRVSKEIIDGMSEIKE